jgi:hypothetical protein
MNTPFVAHLNGTLDSSVANASKLAQTRWTYKHWLVFAGLIVVSLLILLLSTNFLEPHSFLSAFLNQLSTALLISGLWSGVYDLFLRREFIDIHENHAQQVISATTRLESTVKDSTGTISEALVQSADQLSQQLSFAKREELLGLAEARLSAHDYDYTHLILHSENLVLVLNDGRTWVSNHAALLKKRFTDSSKKTAVFLLHPNSSMLEVLAKKVGSNRESLQRKIYETVDLLKDVKTDSTQLAIYGHYLYNAYSLFMGDTYAVVTPYFNSKGRRTVPLFRYDDREGQGDCYYQQLREDVEVLKLDSADLNVQQSE